ncbi:MAG: suppressor of fused domain protein [Caulobacter sp.]|nr:suppressor of fused domain protein [Caulobacter sp.]
MTERAPVTAENREIGRVAAEVFGGEPSVHTWWDDGRKNSVDILSCVGSPGEGLTAYATLTLSNHGLKEVENDLRVEMIAACRSDITAIPKMLSTCAFNVIENGAVIGPGAVFQGALSFYEPGTTVPNILFTPPFFWADGPKTLFMPTRTVAWLLALPISDTEFEHVKTAGYRSLLDLMEEARPNVFDINRASVA